MDSFPDLHSDDILLQGLAKSDPVSFKIIYRLHWRRLYDIALYIARSEEDAEDIVQDVFSSLWYRREQLQVRIALENYLVRAVKYTAFFYLKVQAGKKTLDVPAYKKHSTAVNNTEESIFHKELERMIDDVLGTLPFKTRRIFSLSRFEGLTYPEIAREMGVSVKTVEYHISKALRRLSWRFLCVFLFIFLT